MSRASRRKERAHRWHAGVWKMIDDHSGFEIYSNEAKVDTYRNLITSSKNFDDPFWGDMPVHFDKEEGILRGYVSPEPEDRFINE